MKPFKNVTENLSGEKNSTRSQALPLLRVLKDFLSDQDFFDEDEIIQRYLHANLCPHKNEDFFSSIVHCLKLCQHTILQSFTTRFTGTDANILWISYLDPLCHKMKHLKESERKIARSCLINETVEMCFRADSGADTNKTDDDEEEEPNTACGKKI